MFFDARWAGNNDGIGRFAKELMRRMPCEQMQNSRSPLSPLDPFLTAKYLKKESAEYFFSPGFNAIVGKPCPFSVTVHDLIHLRMSSESNYRKKMYYNVFVKNTLFNAHKVFTVSEFSKNMIVDWSGLSDDKVIVAGNGVGEKFSANVSPNIREKPYILYVGNQKPHKNVPRLIKAFMKSKLAKEVELLLSGYFSNEIARLVNNLNANHCIKAAGFIPEERLPDFYKGAVAVVMPSMYEGFGLPVVEAMSCGTPVLCSNVTSLPEVGGKAALYFDPYSIESIVSVLEKVEDSTLMAQCSESGLQQASLFKWDNVARVISNAIGVGLRQ